MPTEQKSDRPFQDRAELLDFLLEVVAVTSSTLDLDGLLHSLAQMVRNVIRFDLLAVLLYSEARGGLVVRYSMGYNTETLSDLVIPLGEGITGLAAKTRTPIFVGDVKAEPLYLPLVDAVQSELAVPMVLRGKLVGVIDLQSTELNAFTAEDSALLQLIASRATASIVNARLFRQVVRQNRSLRALSRLSQEFTSTLDLDKLLGKVAERIKGLINYDGFSILLWDESQQLLRHRFSLRYDQRVQLDLIPAGKGITGAAAASRKTIRVEDTQADPRYIALNPGIRSELSTPLVVRDRLVGVVDLESDRLGYFTAEHEQWMGLLAPLVAQAIDNARLYEEVAQHKERMQADLDAARRLQEYLLPKEDPGLEGLEIGVGFRPAHEISGDVFDFFEYGEDAIICIGDASGKSAAAALYGAMVTGLLRTLAPRRKSPAALMERLNDALVARRVGSRYLTLLVSRWHPKTRTLTMANAAAAPPLVVRDGKILEPRLEGFPLGLFPDRAYEETVFQTCPGDLLVFYSDGIQEQPGPAGQDYGAARLRPLVATLGQAPAKAVVEAIFADLDEFRKEEPIHDDQTLIAIRVQ
jgi:sigma-B regulation protein RsbU (phosphoserine phosphatase)